MSFVETYLPLLTVVGFLGAWGIAMLTGLMFMRASA